MKNPIILSILLAFLLSPASDARPLSPEEVPEPLAPWVDWVLKDKEDHACPFLYNNHETRRCAWPTSLGLDLAESTGNFSHRWRAYTESWIGLPGDTEHWPQEVTVDGQPARVTERNGRPALQLAPGQHQIRGQWRWEHLPESLAIPPDTGLVTLAIQGKPVDFPVINGEGQLWLQEKDTGRKGRAKVEDHIEIQVFRRVIDEVPTQLVTRIDLDVSGAQREVLLGTALLKDWIPLNLTSPLPARLEPDGRLRLQVRPGRWVIELSARSNKDVTQIPLAESPVPWPKTEVWCFDAQNHIRLVEVEGVPGVDPQQTNLPEEWRHLPAYRMKPGDQIRFKVIRRGDPQPEPDRLTLNRQLWLDFNGEGYTSNDTVTGTMTQGWRLEAGPRLRLGRVAIDGAPQFITALPDSDQPGVEVRRGSLTLSADSRLQGPIRGLPAIGWEHGFHQVNTTLNLPPGWTLLATQGVDNVSDSWMERWTLLDLFLVLITALAIAHLWNRTWGLVALVTLTLLWHEPDAPRQIWLHLLAATALLRVLPEGRFRAAVGLYRSLSLIGLVLIALPFMVEQVRTGLYPQLNPPWDGYVVPEVQVTPAAPPPEAAMDMAPAEEGLGAVRPMEKALRAAPMMATEAPAMPLTEIDPKAKIQTGPGLPDWQWTRIPLSWNGPVERDQSMGLWLISPGMNLGLNLLRVALLAVLAALMFGVGFIRDQGWRWIGTLPVMFALAVLGTGVLPQDARADFPPPKLLQELKERLLAPPECLPACAQVSRMRLEIQPRNLTARLEIHATENTSMPLPAHLNHWLPAQVMVDGAEAAGLYRTPEGELWINLAPGLHQVILSGLLPDRSSLQLPLPLKPHRVDVEAHGWSVEGLHENGLADEQLQLTRLGDAATPTPSALEPAVLPTFARVERTLHLGLDWRVETQVFRMSPASAAVVLEVPLLAGESVTTPDIHVRGGKVQVNLPAGVEAMAWESVLKKAPKLDLTAPDSTSWTEVWRADVSAVWHAEFSGIPVVHHQAPEGRWLPEWRPWPGERISLAVTRPEGVAGQTLTIDNSRLTLTPGERATDVTLDLTLRSSQGGQHTLTLPENARLLSVIINGAAQPIRQEGRQVTLPIAPETRNATLNWQEPEGIHALLKSSPADLGTESVNSRIHITLPEDRWTLFVGGPRLGPAVLFWGVLIVIVLVAIALGRIELTPLKTLHWLLLGIGLSQVPVWSGLVVVGWLLALGARTRLDPGISKTHFNLIQTGLFLLTLAALSLLFDAIQHGLLGLPEMQISGNDSTAQNLNWYQDRASSALPQAWVLSVPLKVYRFLMLAWALWIAFALIRWLRWGWGCFSTHGLWRPFSISKWKAD
jgi:hypothetical protein